MNTSLAFLLIFSSCVMHVGWNAASKGCRDSLAYSWVVTLVSTIIVCPCCVLGQWMYPGAFGWREFLLAMLSGLFESTYCVVLFTSYKHIDVSVGYPIARGTAPVVTLLLGWLVGDAFRAAQVPAVAVALCGVALLSWEAYRRKAVQATSWKGLAFALLTGCCIASYHLVDRCAVSAEAKPNTFTYLFTMHCWMMVWLSLFLASRRNIRDLLVQEWNHGRLNIVLVGLFSYVAYLLVVLALSLGDATMITAGRNMGIVMSLAAGAIFLKERLSRLRVAGALLVTAGVILIFLAGNH